MGIDNKFSKWKMQKLAAFGVEHLKNYGYDTHYAENLDEAKTVVTGMLPSGCTVGVGGSHTLNEIGLIDWLRQADLTFFDRYSQPNFEADLEMRRKSLLADYFITGVNAITKDGKLVNLDSAGNRTAAIAFGPRRVIVVAGANKLVENIDEAMAHLRYIAPMNALRMNHSKLPCLESGQCVDCLRQDSLCNHIGIVNHNLKFPGRISVVFIAEHCGF